MNDDSLKRYLPLLTLIIILGAYLYQYEYYQHFNINISYYIDVTEILLCSSGNIAPLVFIMILVVVILIISPPQIFYNFLLPSKKVIDEVSFKKRIIANYKFILFSLLPIILIGYYYIRFKILGVQNVSFLLPFFLFSLVLCFFYLFMDELQRKHIIYTGNRINENFYIIILFTTSYFIFMYFTAYGNYFVTTFTNYSNGTYFKTKEKVYSCDSTTQLIGQTKNYIFLYQNTTKSTLVIRSSDVIEQSIKLKAN